MSRNEKLERELESFLAEENSRVAALYRKLPHHEPDAKLDESVLAMARSAVAPKRPRNYWMPALSAAAIAILVVGISYRTILQEWRERAAPAAQSTINEPATTPPAPKSEAQAFPAAPAQTPAAALGGATASAPAPAAKPTASDALARRKATDLPRATAAPPLRESIAQPQISSSAAQNRLDKSAASVAPPPPPDSSAPLQQLDAKVFPPKEPEKETVRAGASGHTQAEQALDRAESVPSMLKNASPSPVTSPAPAPPASAPATTSAAAMRMAPGNHLYPEHWIANIQQLLHDDKRDEAVRSLNEFRKQYPDYPLPDDLRGLK
jgi:hypothetical protein